jgi:hypothetical protein
MKQPQQISTTEQLRSSSGFTPSFRQWRRRWLSFSSRRTSASADPIEVVVARGIHEEESQDLEEEDLVVEQVDTRNGATTESRIPSNPVGMNLPTTSEASLEL